MELTPAPTPRSLRRRLTRHGARILAGLSLFLLSQAARELGPFHGPDCSCAVAPWLGQEHGVGPPPAPREAALRVVTFNIHSGLGPSLTRRQPREGVRAHLDAIARAVVDAAPAACPVDAVALNEVDFGADRSGGIDQAEYLAAALAQRTGRAWQAVRGVTWERDRPGDRVRFGNALLVRHPLLRARAHAFDTPPPEGSQLPAVPSPALLDRVVREARGVIEATIATPAGEVDLYVTHLDAFSQDEREAQAVHLLHRLAPGRTSVVLGDLNAVPAVSTRARRPYQDDLTHDLLTSDSLADARVVLAARSGRADLDPWATYPAAAPVWSLDGVLATLDLSPLEARTIGAGASDHLGLVVAYGRTDEARRATAATWQARVKERQAAHVERCLGGRPGPESVGEPLLEQAAALTAPISSPPGLAAPGDRRRRLVAASGYGRTSAAGGRETGSVPAGSR